jgi:hypothetical protein
MSRFAAESDRDPASDQRLVLRADPTGPVEWSSDTLECRTEGKRVTVGLREGRHEIEARETAVTSNPGGALVGYAAGSEGAIHPDPER